MPGASASDHRPAAAPGVHLSRMPPPRGLRIHKLTRLFQIIQWHHFAAMIMLRCWATGGGARDIRASASRATKPSLPAVRPHSYSTGGCLPNRATRALRPWVPLGSAQPPWLAVIHLLVRAVLLRRVVPHVCASRRRRASRARHTGRSRLSGSRAAAVRLRPIGDAQCDCDAVGCGSSRRGVAQAGRRGRAPGAGLGIGVGGCGRSVPCGCHHARAARRCR